MTQILPGASASVFARSHYFGKGDGYIRDSPYAKES